MPGISGIYQIQSKIKPERIYIGSAINIQKRKIGHLGLLRKNKHHSIRLQNHYNKYGESDLVFSIIEPCLSEYLITREQYYIDNLKTWFNVRVIAESNLGIHWTSESRKNRSDSFKGKNTWSKGRSFSEEHKENLRIASIGRKASIETRLKQRETQIRIGNKPPAAWGKEPWNKGLKNPEGVHGKIRKIA